MIKTKPFLIALATALTAVATPSVRANELLDQHQSLWEDLERVGVTIYVNDPAACRSRSFQGRYISRMRRLDVCQDNYAPYTQTQWTANDLDTLRHEAHHVVQDCNGEPYDVELDAIFDDNELTSFVARSHTEKQIEQIITSYRDRGADRTMILNELESFSVARSVSADTIGDKLIEFCDVSKM